MTSTCFSISHRIGWQNLPESPTTQGPKGEAPRPREGCAQCRALRTLLKTDGRKDMLVLLRLSAGQWQVRWLIRESRENTRLKTNINMEHQPYMWINSRNNHGFTMKYKVCLDVLLLFTSFVGVFLFLVRLIHGVVGVAALRTASAWRGSFPVGGPGWIVRERCRAIREGWWTLFVTGVPPVFIWIFGIGNGWFNEIHLKFIDGFSLK